ncbi:MAG: polysaccharide deacetylase family protein [Fusicatenibacter saccharivorans]
MRHVPLPLLAVIMAAILFAELARCEREGAKETAAEAEKSVPRRAALTFDDGPNACYTPEVLEILKENEIPATFFLQGQCLAGNEEIVRRMHAEGHLIGNHTFHHVQLTKVSEEEAREEVVKTSNAIYEITGEYPVYIRPPFGEWREGAGPCSDDDPGTLGCGFPRLGEPEHRVDLQRGASECEGWQHYSHA